jgi:hypothetical protein
MGSAAGDIPSGHHRFPIAPRSQPGIESTSTCPTTGALSG